MIGDKVWDIRLVKKHQHIPVKQIINWGEVGQDTWLITVWSDKLIAQVASDLWSGRSPF